MKYLRLFKLKPAPIAVPISREPFPAPWYLRALIGEGAEYFLHFLTNCLETKSPKLLKYFALIFILERKWGREENGLDYKQGLPVHRGVLEWGK